MPNQSSSPNSPNMPSPSNSVSPKDERIDICQPSLKDNSLMDTFNNSRMPYPNNAALANYYNALYRYPSLYSSAHHLAAAARSMPRYDPYSTFMQSVPFSPAPQSQLPSLPVNTSIQISQQNGVKPHGMDRSQQSMPVPSLVPPLPIAQQMYKEKVSHTNNHITNNNNNINNCKDKLSPNSQNNNNNNINHDNNVGFKVPSGKEGSLKHRILTRPYDKDSKQRSPPGGNGLTFTNRYVFTIYKNNL